MSGFGDLRWGSACFYTSVPQQRWLSQVYREDRCGTGQLQYVSTCGWSADRTCETIGGTLLMVTMDPNRHTRQDHPNIKVVQFVRIFCFTSGMCPPNDSRC